jgi:hypothetical protein
MTHPAAAGVPGATGYPAPPAYAPPAAPAPYGVVPGAFPPGPPSPPPAWRDPKRPRVGRFLGLVVAILIAGLLGGVVGALITHQTESKDVPAAAPIPQAPAPPSAETIRTQNVQLCTAYAIINSAMPKPQENALQVLPGVNGLRWALAENPAASPDIRAAIIDVVHNYDALIAAFGEVRTRGLAEPPPYDIQQAQQLLNHAWDVCQLGS